MRYGNIVAVLILALVSTVAQADGYIVKPEKNTHIVLSNQDVNRIVCEQGDITDAYYSKEKGVIVKLAGSNAFVKTQMKRKLDSKELIRSVLSVDLHFVCNGQVYTLIGSLKPIPGQKISLVGGKKKIQENIRMLAAMPYEKRIGWIMRSAYRNEYPDSFTVKKINQPFADMGPYFVDIIKKIRVEGMGLQLTEYLLTTTAFIEEHLLETEFLQAEFGKNIAAVSIDSEKKSLEPNEKIRVFIIERVNAQ